MIFEALAIIIQLVLLEGILSLDNAAVMAAMARKLPNDSPSPWPVQRLGEQRFAALKAGLLAAIAVRAALIYGTAQLTKIWHLRSLAAIYLGYLAISHFVKLVQTNEDGQENSKPANGKFWKTVVAVELADLSFSLDNVLAAVALSDKIVFIIIGVAIGMIAVRFAATWFQGLMSSFPETEHAAFVIVGAIGLELAAKDLLDIRISDTQQFGINATIMLLAMSISLVRKRRRATKESRILPDIK